MNLIVRSQDKETLLVVNNLNIKKKKVQSTKRDLNSYIKENMLFKTYNMPKE